MKISRTIKVVQTPITFKSLETNATFTYDPSGKELLAKTGEQKAVHLNEQKFIEVEPGTAVYQVFW